eukprot:231986-Hanusia_phi.AAC.2
MISVVGNETCCEKSRGRRQGGGSDSNVLCKEWEGDKGRAAACQWRQMISEVSRETRRRRVKKRCGVDLVLSS